MRQRKLHNWQLNLAPDDSRIIHSLAVRSASFTYAFSARPHPLFPLSTPFLPSAAPTGRVMKQANSQAALPLPVCHCMTPSSAGHGLRGRLPKQAQSTHRPRRRRQLPSPGRRRCRVDGFRRRSRRCPRTRTRAFSAICSLSHITVHVCTPTVVQELRPEGLRAQAKA